MFIDAVLEHPATLEDPHRDLFTPAGLQLGIPVDVHPFDPQRQLRSQGFEDLADVVTQAAVVRDSGMTATIRNGEPAGTGPPGENHAS